MRMSTLRREIRKWWSPRRVRRADPAVHSRERVTRTCSGDRTVVLTGTAVAFDSEFSRSAGRLLKGLDRPHGTSLSSEQSHSTHKRPAHVRYGKNAGDLERR